jgi:hypothetical protein
MKALSLDEMQERGLRSGLAQTEVRPGANDKHKARSLDDRPTSTCSIANVLYRLYRDLEIIPTRLNWIYRPRSVQMAIEEDYIYHQDLWNLGGGWCSGYDGDAEYRFCKIKLSIALRIYIDSHPTQNEFLVLIIGARNCLISKNLVNLINNEYAQRQIHVSFFNLQQENPKGPDQQEAGLCTIHYIKHCNFERLSERLEKYSLTNRIDLCASQLCFRFLVDPLGTLVQAYDLLRPNGLLFMDDFVFRFEGQTVTSGSYANILAILKFIDTPFAIWGDRCKVSCQFVLQKNKPGRAEIPVLYSHVEHRNWEHSLTALLVVFKCNGVQPDFETREEPGRQILTFTDGALYGTPELISFILDCDKRSTEPQLEIT